MGYIILLYYIGGSSSHEIHEAASAECWEPTTPNETPPGIPGCMTRPMTDAAEARRTREHEKQRSTRKKFTKAERSKFQHDKALEAKGKGKGKSTAKDK